MYYYSQSAKVGLVLLFLLLPYRLCIPTLGQPFLLFSRGGAGDLSGDHLCREAMFRYEVDTIWAVEKRNAFEERHPRG